MNKIAKQLVQKVDVDKLPSLPHVLLQLLEICNDESLSFERLATIIKQDPGLYAQFYSAHNHNITASAQSVPAQPIEHTLKQLGTNTIKSIVVTATVHQFFSR